MYGYYNEFHESYYNHNCLIIPEKDVLDTDIVGTGFVTRLQRWWNDLFLLSCTGARSRGFYLSSHAISIERLRQFRKYRSRIHPMSKFRNFWDFIILHVIIMNKVIFRFTSSFLFDKLPMGLYYFGALFELIIIADLYVNIKTGFINFEAKRVILDAKRSLINFCAKKLFIYSAAAIPLHWFMFLRYGSDIDCGLCKANRYTCILKIISIFSLFRVYEMSTYWTKKRHPGNRKYCFKFLRIMAVGLVTMCQFYDLSDVVCLLVFFETGYVPPTSALGIRTGIKYGAMDYLIPNYMYVCYDLSRILRSLLLFSFGVGKAYYLDRITSLIAYLIANAFYCWSLLECYALICRIMYPRDQLLRKNSTALNMLTCQQISDELRSKVQEYFDYKPTKLHIIMRENELFRNLPDVLKREVKLSCYIKRIMRIPFFAEWPLPVVEDIVQMLNKEFFLKNDIVSEAWVSGIGLMIVDCGILAIYSQLQKETGHLIDGDYFGEMSLVTDKELCMSFVVSITPCTILILDKYAFRKYMRDYPKLFYDMETQMKERYKSPISMRRISKVARERLNFPDENIRRNIQL